MDSHIQELLDRIEELEARMSMLECHDPPNSLPPNFDGSTDFNQWLEVFDAAAKRNSWNKRTCAEMFPFFLKDMALALYESFPMRVKSDWETLIRKFPEELAQSKEEEKLADAYAACVCDFFENMHQEESEYPDDEFFDAPGYDDDEADDDGDDQDEFWGPSCGPFGDSDYDDEDEYDPEDYEDEYDPDDEYEGGFRRSPNFWRPSTHSA